jgi:hypothetical protein
LGGGGGAAGVPTAGVGVGVGGLAAGAGAAAGAGITLVARPPCTSSAAIARLAAATQRCSLARFSIFT